MTAPSKPKGSTVNEQPYHWFQGASVRELYDRLSAAGPDTARLEVRIQDKSMTLRVVSGAQAASAAGDINDSRLCPPIC